MEITTLCYIEKDNKYLMLHRIKKKNDINEGKWIAPGGHLENGESPDDCVRREVLEETGLTLNSARFRGIVTFISKPAKELEVAADGNVNEAFTKDITDYMCLFTSDDFDGELIDCDEGTLEWISKDSLLDINLWKGDLIFLDLIKNPDQPFFSLKLTYEGGELTEAVLDGKILDID
ncbi:MULTISPECIES: NUDIX hydrolase [unclassified Butyrivibrio]|uniref:NUDIX hydrolase n=1 Tax=unclassified Butyrivibrio TaxID=2639466 RepID=UPI00040F412B|nr:MULTISPECIES: 8-oxo-dGTP diphosphatase [unclassified Butyrivibrio]